MSALVAKSVARCAWRTVLNLQAVEEARHEGAFTDLKL